MTEALTQHLAGQGVRLDGVYHCPHHPKGTVPALAVDCNCRKPAPGMLLQAARELGLPLPDCLLIGDKPSDIEAAWAAGVGCCAYSVYSDNAEASTGDAGADAHFTSLLDCAHHILTASPEKNA